MIAVIGRALDSPPEELLREFVHAASSHRTITVRADWAEIVDIHVATLALSNDVTTVETAIGNFGGAATDTRCLGNVGTDVFVPH